MYRDRKAGLINTKYSITWSPLTGMGDYLDVFAIPDSGVSEIDRVKRRSAFGSVRGRSESLADGNPYRNSNKRVVISAHAMFVYIAINDIFVIATCFPFICMIVCVFVIGT
jgi:hypothetical protein